MKYFQSSTEAGLKPIHLNYLPSWWKFLFISSRMKLKVLHDPIKAQLGVSTFKETMSIHHLSKLSSLY